MIGPTYGRRVFTTTGLQLLLDKDNKLCIVRDLFS